jgi:hypothetical protein
MTWLGNLAKVHSIVTLPSDGMMMRKCGQIRTLSMGPGVRRDDGCSIASCVIPAKAGTTDDASSTPVIPAKAGIHAELAAR